MGGKFPISCEQGRKNNEGKLNGKSGISFIPGGVTNRNEDALAK